jgi:hypothetical protein
MNNLILALILCAAAFALRMAMIWRLRRTGALDGPPPEIDGRRIFRQHPAALWALLLPLTLGGAAAMAEELLIFLIASLMMVGICFLVVSKLYSRVILADDRLEIEFLGQSLRRVALSDVVQVRHAGRWTGGGLILRSGKPFPLAADLVGLSWLTDRIERRIAPHASE